MSQKDEFLKLEHFEIFIRFIYDKLQVPTQDNVTTGSAVSFHVLADIISVFPILVLRVNQYAG